MQQVATNIAINYPDNIRSVNGPPGTGKTTLLKDIFAHILVCQAVSICQLHDKKIRGSLAYWDQAKIGVLPANIAGGNIVVASSNNGAVQNIVNELPLKDNISSEFLEKLLEVDYFKDISNSVIEGVGFGKERRINLKKREDKNWGTFSLEGGTATNVNNLLLVIEAIEKELDESYCPNERIYQEFLHLYNRMLAQKQKFQQHYEQWKKFYELKNEYEECSSRYKRDKKSKEFDLASAQKNITKEIETYEQKNRMILDKLDDISHTIDILNDSLKQAERSYDLIRSQEPSLMWFQKIFNKSKVEQYFEDLNRANSVLNDLVDQKRELLESQACYEKSLRENNRRINIFQSERQNMNVQFNQWLNRQQSQLKQLEKRINQLNSLKLLNKVKELDFSQTYCDLQKSNPWFDKDFRVMQTELFIAALKVKKQFLYDNRKNLSKARMIWRKQADYISKVNGSQIIGTAWQWLNCAIPVISTTFASLGIMFGNLPENSISNVFIDEAGQALPQASVGAIFRSKRVMAVGDPAQIRPVLTLDSNTLNLIGRHYDVSEKFVSAIASTQTIMDDASRFGFWKDKDKEEWIGIPLWVHRRSNYPMFTISNEISYNGLMVQGKPDEKAYGKAKWYAVTGKANDKFVKEQADLLIKLISERIQKDVQLADEIYVITPFKNVAYRLAQELDKIKFTKRKDKKPMNVGTVHTFQGKEAKIVYLVLGADSESKGAAYWAVSEPNIMNVAATRAKEEFYIIGDRSLYAKLGSNVANTTLRIIDDYNAELARWSEL